MTIREAVWYRQRPVGRRQSSEERPFVVIQVLKFIDIPIPARDGTTYRPMIEIGNLTV